MAKTIEEIMSEVTNGSYDYINVNDCIKIAKLYANEKLEDADKMYKSKAIKSINTAIKHFERLKDEGGLLHINTTEIISFLYAFSQFEAQGLFIVGMGYRRYDGKDIKSLDGMYEGGFFTMKKPHSILNLREEV